MYKRTTFRTLVHRVAEESQLLAEEKWIIEALNKIKTQRNCLQIERLQLESMKNQIMMSSNKTTKEDPPLKNVVDPVNIPDNKMQNVLEEMSAEPTTSADKILETEALCNNEELDLNVTNSIFSKISSADLNIEEDEEDEEDDDEDILIEINMLMHGVQDDQPKPEN